MRPEINSLTQWQLSKIIDSASGSSHILLPRIATRLPAPSRLLLPAKRPSYFCSRRSHIHINNSSVAS